MSVTWRSYREDESPEVGDVVRQSCCDWAFSNAIICAAFLSTDRAPMYTVSRPHCHVSEFSAVFTALEKWDVSNMILRSAYQVACGGIHSAVTGEDLPKDNRKY